MTDERPFLSNKPLIMGCCISSPHQKRRYNDPSDLDEEYVPIRYFGTNRVGSNLVPDDIGGLPSTHIAEHLASNKDLILYSAEIDQGKAWRWFSFDCLCLLTPWGLAYLLSKGCSQVWKVFPCDESCCWLRKEYSTRTYFRIYSNRIEINNPNFRFPFGLLGCGSWSGDSIIAHPFDRGAFGFQHVRSGTLQSLCCLCPTYGHVVARHRCQCNGPLWNRMFTDCGGWWCDEWLCQMCFCSYHYIGIAYPDEVAFAASIALQAYFEGRSISPIDMKKCIEFWTKYIDERGDPIGRKRPVCCEPVFVPMPPCIRCYKFSHHPRKIPYPVEKCTPELIGIYKKYEEDVEKQINDYESFEGPVYYSTLCRACGCKRIFGRKGCCFCTEGCTNCSRKAGEPAPPFEDHDFEDEWDASTILIKVLGPPPQNVCIRRWRWDPASGKNYLESYPDVNNVQNS